ncbi:MAG: nucleoside deaminase [Microthrixaceae bacterium]
MGSAIDAATDAASAGEVPVGACVVHLGDGGADFEVLAVRGNERERTGDPTAHAEVLALRDAADTLGRWRLDDCLLMVTLEPCPMCAGAAWASRIGGVIFGATNPDAGATGTLYHLGQDPRLNHEFPTLGGVRSEECAALLHDFFKQHR